MLSDKEKRELREDGLNTKRREDFRIGESLQNIDTSLDAYINFLNGIQKVFSPFEISDRITITRSNRL